MAQRIELDCPPGPTRPSDLLIGVLADTQLGPRAPSCTSFGCWTFDYTDIDPIVWAIALPRIEARITQLYQAGAIRYGAWC